MRSVYFYVPDQYTFDEALNNRNSPAGKTFFMAEKIEPMIRDGIKVLKVTYPKNAELFLEIISPGLVKQFKQVKKQNEVEDVN
jgi:hypothetical protein